MSEIVFFSFLQDAHDAILERLREQELSKVARVIQRVMLGIKDRCRLLRMKIRSIIKIMFFFSLSQYLKKEKQISRHTLCLCCVLGYLSLYDLV